MSEQETKKESSTNLEELQAENQRMRQLLQQLANEKAMASEPVFRQELIASIQNLQMSFHNEEGKNNLDRIVKAINVTNDYLYDLIGILEKRMKGTAQ